MHVFFFMFSVNAESDSYEIPELNLAVSIPDEYDVFTLDMSSDDPLFLDYGITKADIDANFSSSNIYLNAISTSQNEEIVVTMIDSTLENFNRLGETTLSMLVSALVDEYEDYGILVTDYDIYHHDQLTFIQIYFHDTEETVYGLQFYTVSNAQAINFTLRSYEGNISSGQEKTIYAVVDSICLNYEVEAATAELPPAFIYTDNTTGLTFTVPKGWREVVLTEERDFLNTKFESVTDPGLVILYGSMDFWSELSADKRAGYVRSDISSDLFSKQDIADVLDIEAHTIDIVSYDGVRYFKFKTEIEEEITGLNLSVSMIQFLRIENGWAYTFQFGADETNAYYDDFVNLVKSAEYSKAMESGSAYPEASPSDTNDSGASDSASGILPGFFIVCLAIASVADLLIIKRRKTRKAYWEAAAFTGVTAQPAAVKGETQFCHICGMELPGDSMFCHKCGTKLHQEK